MKNKTASICILCEGYEEYDYLQTLINKNIFQDKYLIKLINVKGINRLYSRYISTYQSDSYHCVFIFCDTDKKKQDPYWELKKNINEFHNADVAEDIIYFGNPCTMQIILSHFEKVSLTKPSKKINSSIIEQLTSIKNYNATEEQRKLLMSKITKTNYNKMKENLNNISKNDEIIPSTNFLKLIDNLENDNEDWIKEINNKL